jgi:hypothetical protein
MQSWKDILGQILFLFVFYGCLLMIGLCVATRVFGAPIPSYKPTLMTIHHGYWEIDWGGVRCYALLARDGTFKCIYEREQWRGTWAWDKNTNTLYVTEKGPNRNYGLQWKVSLSEDLQGRAIMEGRNPEIQTLLKIKRLSMK